MMLRARSQFGGALAMVALLHQQITYALAATIRALPFVPFNVAVVLVAHFFPLKSQSSMLLFRAAVCH